MIHHLKGTLKEKSPTRIIVEVGGIGYEAAITLSSFESLPDTETDFELLTYLHVREDNLQLFGFTSSEERETFLHLISVSGIGPKLAQGILSGIASDELRMRISEGDVTALARLRGVGKKTAQRLVLDLRDKLGAPAGETEAMFIGATKVQKKVIEEALLALLSLGYTRTIAQGVMEKTLAEVSAEEVAKDEEHTVEELVKRALRNV
jgi:Holliday junction DNA helicase RuvA